MSGAYSFSIPPKNKKEREIVEKLRTYSNQTGISFSYLVTRAIEKYVEDLKL